MSQTFLEATSQKGLFEDLANFIKEISYTETPFLTRCGTTQAKNLDHYWTTQALRAAGTNRRTGGYTPSFAGSDVTVRVKQTNAVQFLAVPYSVEDSLDWIEKVEIGQTSEFENQQHLKRKELALDLDYTLLNESYVQRDDNAGTAGQMKGAINWAAGSLTVGAGNQPLTEDLYSTLAQAVAEASGEMVDTAFVNGKQKRAITNWTTAIRRFVDDNKKYVNTVGQYDGDWGTQTIVWDLQMPAGTLLLCKMGYLKVAFGVPMKLVELGKSGDTRRGYIKTEATLEVQNPNTVATLTGLA